MKPYSNLSTIEKAEILYELFPEEIPAFINFSSELVDIIITHPEELTGYFTNLLHTTPFWKKMVNNVKGDIEKFKNKLAEDCSLFSSRLFHQYQSIFSCYCLHQYAISGKCTNKKFLKALEFFFFF